MQYPKAQTIHLVMDNLNIHHRKSLVDIFGIEIGSEIWDRFTVHYTPLMGVGSIKRKSKSASSRGNASGTAEFRTFKTLRRESQAWNRRINRERIKINWKFDRRAARRKFGYKTNLSSGRRPSPGTGGCRPRGSCSNWPLVADAAVA